MKQGKILYIKASWEKSLHPHHFLLFHRENSTWTHRQEFLSQFCVFSFLPFISSFSKMESFRNNRFQNAPSQMGSDGFSSPTQTSWFRPDSGSGFTANQMDQMDMDQMPVSALTSPLISQAAPPFAHEYPVDFQHPDSNSWCSITSAGMFPTSSTNPQQQHPLVGNHPTLSVAYPPSPFAAPSQNPISFYQPGCASEASNTTTNMFTTPLIPSQTMLPPAAPTIPGPAPNQNSLSSYQPGYSSEGPNTTANVFRTPIVPSQTMLPPASPIIPRPANTNTTERARSIRDDREWTRHKDIIWKLYMKENRTLEATMNIMKEDYRFVAE